MMKRILVPIGARERSETIVPVVAALAQSAGSTVRLLRVFPIPERVVGPQGRTVAYADQEMARLTAAGLADLRRGGARPPAPPGGRRASFWRPRQGKLLGGRAFHARLFPPAAVRPRPPPGGLRA